MDLNLSHSGSRQCHLLGGELLQLGSESATGQGCLPLLTAEAVQGNQVSVSGDWSKCLKLGRVNHDQHACAWGFVFAQSYGGEPLLFLNSVARGYTFAW